jgi:hypothetical protein
MKANRGALRGAFFTFCIYLGAFLGAWILWTINKLWR